MAKMYSYKHQESLLCNEFIFSFGMLEAFTDEETPGVMDYQDQETEEEEETTQTESMFLCYVMF